jgi:Domain of unknown function (DUF4381)
MSRRPSTHASRACAAAATGLVAAFLIPLPVAAAPPIAATLPAAAVPVAAALPAAAPPVAAALPAAALPRASVGAAAADLATADDIRDIRGPKGIFPLWKAVAWLAGMALLAVAGYAAWRWARRRRSPRALELFEIALERLEEIRVLMQPSSVREFSIAISDIVRRYIEDEFKVTATHRTTEEFLRDLLESSNASLAAHRNLLAQFLSQCDMAKFAGVGLSMQIMESLHQSARSFVIESSKPLPASKPAAEGHTSPTDTTPASSRSTPAKEAHDSLPST